MTDPTEIQAESPDNPHRRRLLQGLAGVLGAAAATQLTGGKALSVALAWQPRADLLGPGQMFDAHGMAVLRAVCDITIPRTDTPGAADVDAHGFIDNQLLHAHARNEQEAVQDLVFGLNQVARSRHGADFVMLEPGQQLDLLVRLEGGRNPFHPRHRNDFKLLKGLVLFGYFTSEAGCKQALAYDPVPGGFKGSIPYDSVGKAWAPGGIF